METFSENEKDLLRSLSGKPHTYHAKEILESFFDKMQDSDTFEEVKSIVDETEQKIVGLYTEVDSVILDDLVVGLISVNTIYDKKSKIIIRKYNRITTSILQALEKVFHKNSEGEGEIMVEILLPEAHKVHEVMISQLSRFKKNNNLHQNNNKKNNHLNFNIAVDQILREGV